MGVQGGVEGHRVGIEPNIRGPARPKTNSGSQTEISPDGRVERD